MASIVNNDWGRIEALFHATIGLSPEERSAYLTRACGENLRLRSEVEAYLAAFDLTPELLEKPVFDLGLRALSIAGAMQSFAGKHIGAYRILEQLGEGGMGEVYLAEDTDLGREVALKFLSQPLIHDAWARRQLKREAQAVAKLDHPNICTVYDFEEIDGHSFIVMQRVEGETLHSLIQKAALPSNRISEIAAQIAGALAQAHAYGIIHRDIKPKNIMVSARGQVKVLDFGLAQFTRQGGLNPDQTESRPSSHGRLVGTVKYMSPEQLKTGKLDFRTDIFSFGVVLYEMITGHHPFARESEVETMSAILYTEPPPELAGPESLLQIARKCLQKDREQRYQSVNEILLDLDEDLKGKIKPRPRPFPLRLRAPILLAALLLAVIVAAILYFNMTRIRTLAVLPITNQSEDQSVDYLGDGLTDTLTQGLSRLPRLKVKPRTLFYGYKEKAIDPIEMGRSLKADLILSAAIVKRNEGFALETRLLRVDDASEAWVKTYPLDPAQLLSLHRELCDEIAENALFYLRASERNLLWTKQTQNASAFQHYLQARSYWNNRSKENILRAIEEYRKALILDPDFPQALAGLADCYTMRTTVAYGSLPTREALPIARDYALNALRGDNTIAEAHISLGIVNLRYEWEYEQAEKEFKLAIGLNPEAPEARYWYSRLLALTGRTTESIAESQKAFELDPSSKRMELNLGVAYYYARDIARADAHFRKMLVKYPGDQSVTYLLGLCVLQSKDFNAVIKMLEPLRAKDKTLVAAPLGFAYAKSGRSARARRILAELEAASQENKDGVPPQEKAIILLALNERNRSFAFFLEACTDRFATFPFIKVDPLFDDLRSDPRYRQLLQCAHLAP